jgi:outer membrane protein assembly factor BamB
MRFIPASLLPLIFAGSVFAAPSDDALALAGKAGFKNGFVVRIGADADVAAALKLNAGTQVHVIDTDSARVAAARNALLGKGIYGDVSADGFDGKSLPYIDGVVNLLIADDPGAVPADEILRVLVPNGVAFVRGERIVKQPPKGLDEWTHYFYDAKGNATSHDDIVGPPDRLQWLGSPRWSRHHDRISSTNAQVTSGGRLFTIMDEGSRISALLPSHWKLNARDAFNGVALWSRDIGKWQPHMWPLKSGPTQLTRRLVGAGDRVFVTLEIDGPISALDAATGATVREFPESKGTEEMLHVDGVIYALVNPRPYVLEDFAPKLNTGDQKRVETEFNWDQKPRNLLAIEAATGKVLWRKDEAKIAPLTLAADGKRVVFHDGDKLVLLDAKTGEAKWSSEPASKRKLFEFNFGPRVLITGDTILYAGGDGEQAGFDADSGKRLWGAPHQKSGYRSPEDLIVAGGLVWNAGTLSGGQDGVFSGRDIRTGEVKKSFPPDVNTYWFHHRCYIAKATDNFIIPSRTGIEFVDIEKKSWDINHWVRGACLYGVIPANGLTYAGPHNCACYPEAKLDGMNALAPATGKAWPKPGTDEERLTKGPAYGFEAKHATDERDWPTYRHDAARSGFTNQPLLPSLASAWSVKLGGKLSAPTIEGGRVYVAQVDAHTLHALDAETGTSIWKYTAGARVDSPPTVSQGRVYFGGKDGFVYCLRASDGALVWRFQAAPADRRHFAFEQLESVWPVHGSVLVTDGKVSFVAGRSIFLDGGLRFISLDAMSGKKLVEEVYNDRDPETGKDIQERVQTLQMPVGLNDILSSDGKWTYLRTQKIGADGKRVEIGPVSGNAVAQGAAQKGEGSHIFAPMGFLDDSWFHRSYWVYGKSFAGGHNGYYQAGKFAPAGRILVFDDAKVYGYGRESKYYKWTTTMEHQLFAASRDAANEVNAPVEAAPAGAKKQAAQAGLPIVRFPQNPKLDPSGKALTVEAWILPDDGDGVVMAFGGPANGYALSLHEGKPVFSIRSKNELTKVEFPHNLPAPIEPGKKWYHLAGVLDSAQARIYVDGKLVAQGAAKPLDAMPKQPLELGGDSGGSVGDYDEDFAYTGMLDGFAIVHRAMSEAEIAARYDAEGLPADAIVACNFDKGDARDSSANGIHGIASGVATGKGRGGSGGALWFKDAAPLVKGGKRKKGGGNAGGAGSFVKHEWERFVPVVTRAMAMAGKTVFLAGPPDLVDEEYAFERMTKKDPAIQTELAEQDAALDGKRGAVMHAVNAETGETSDSVKLDKPPVWDGMAIARGAVFVSDVDGSVTRYGVEKK